MKVGPISKLAATLKDDTTDNKRTLNYRQNANPSQNKKNCNATHKPTQIAAHFILPKAPKPTPTLLSDK
jgi:hypothetical protein